MNAKDMGERILFLRKNKGVTQEQLAQALNISNQAVSKWEAGQCYPDIQLIPEIAGFFKVSVNELFGEKTSEKENDLQMRMKNLISGVPTGHKYDEVLKIARSLHAILWVEETKDIIKPQLKMDETVDHAINTEWGLSHISLQKIRTGMKGGCVFFAGNEKLHMDEYCLKLARFLKVFANRWVLGVFFGLYDMTSEDEDIYIDCENLAESLDIPESEVKKIVAGDLKDYLTVNKDGFVRIKEEYMNIPAIMSLLAPIM